MFAERSEEARKGWDSGGRIVNTSKADRAVSMLITHLSSSLNEATNPHASLGNRCYYCSPFLDEETEERRA